MQVQINKSFAEANTSLKLGNTNFLVTPPLDGDYWLMRVPVSDSQAIICFPKFGVIGIGFQVEDDWNTNLPHSYDTKEIFKHISHNKGDDSIPDEVCIEAIELLKSAIEELSA